MARDRATLGSLLHEPESFAALVAHAGSFMLPGGLDDASLLDVCHSMVWSSCGLLFDTRAADLVSEGNTILLVIRRVTQLSLVDQPPHIDRYNWTAWNSKVDVNKGDVTVATEFDPNGSLSVTGTDVFAFDLDVPGLSEAPPDYGMDAEVDVAGKQPSWTSTARLCGMAYLGPLGGTGYRS
jgi:hypothetical protein